MTIFSFESTDDRLSIFALADVMETKGNVAMGQFVVKLLNKLLTSCH